MKNSPLEIVVHRLLLGLLALLLLMPLYGMVSLSLKTPEQVQDVASLSSLLFPDPVRTANYSDVFRYIDFVRYYFNTFYVTFMTIIGAVISSSLVAYGFARFRWPGRDAVFLLMLSTMMLPPQVTIIPQFILFTRLGWANTFLPLWTPAFFGVPFSIFLLRQFLLGVPKDLEEASVLDGCSPLGTFFRVMLPLIKPAILAVVVFHFLWAWNDFIGPLIYLHQDRLQTLTLALLSFQSLHQTEWPQLMAAATMMTVPAIGVFFFAQRYFIEGITLTGMKG